MESVCVITPTYKRHRFIPILIKQFQKQNYEGEMSMIILDDSPTRYPFAILDSRITYIYEDKRNTIVKKRNKLNAMVNSDIIVCMDDDDLYSEHRVKHAVESLSDKSIQIVGCSSLYIYNLKKNDLFFYRAFNKKCILNCTFAYRKELLRTQKYIPTVKDVYEEKSFTNNFRLKMKFLEDEKTIVCIAHNNNTVDKNKFCKKKVEKVVNLENIRLVYNVHPILYWINLNQSVDRQRTMMKQFETHKFTSHYRIEGISESYIETQLYNKGQIGCMLSHFKAMEVSLEDTYRDYAVICEDDIYLKHLNHFNDIIFYYVESAPKNWDVLQLYVIRDKIRCDSTSWLKWEKWTQGNFSTMIYIIKKDYIRKLLEKKRNWKDRGMLADDFIYRNGITYSICVPYFSEMNTFKSLIDKSHAEFHKRNEKLLNKKRDKLEKIYPFSMN